MIRILLSLTITCSIFNLHSQILDIKPTLQLKGKFKSNKLWLRWVIFDQNQWYEARDRGYTLNKYVLNSGGKTLVWSKSIKPLAKELWSRNQDSMSMSETVFDLLYLSDAELKHALPKKADSTEYSYSLDEIRETRYFLLLWAANQNFQAALIQGVGYEDSEIIRNRIYDYVLICGNDSASVHFDPNSTAPPLVPVRPQISIDETNTKLQWESSSRFETYHCYQVEISKEGNRFTPISSDLIHNYIDAKFEKGYRSNYYWQDSTYPGQQRWYRLRGMDYFGELNNPGPSVGIRFPVILPPPIALDFENLSAITRLNWYFPKNLEHHMSHFQVWTTDSLKGDKILIQDNIPSFQRSTNIKSKLITKFYFIATVRSEGATLYSFPIMVTPVDRDAPLTPIGIRGFCDSIGVVHLMWSKNTTPDLEGYRLFRANNRLDEFSQISIQPFKENFFIDTIDLNNLNNTIYYKIAAEDNHGNMSALSIPIEIIKYDTIAPSSPQFYRWIPEERSVRLFWHQSSSIDLSNTKILRKLLISHEWEVLGTFLPSESENYYLDQNIDPDSTYIYTLIAQDKSGNLSQESEYLTARPLGITKYPAIQKITAFFDSTSVANHLSWEYLVDQVSEYWIYRSEGTSPLTLLLTLDSFIYSWVDTNVTKGKIYTYRIKALFQNGRDSFFSKPIYVNSE